MKLRDYQLDTLDAVASALRRGVNRPACVLATGLGKTVIFSRLIREWTGRNPAGKVLVLVHRDELATQARDKITADEPSLTVGIVKAGRNEVDAQVIVASVQTLAREHRRDAIRGVGLIIVDECHHAAAKTWREVLAHFGAWDGVPCIGFTATMHREDGKGLGEVWQEVVITRDIVWGVKHSWLVRPRGLRIRIPQLHLEDKSLIVAGEYQKDRVAAAMINADTGPAIARAIVQYAPTLRMATFGPNVAACESFVDAMRDEGLMAELITGKTAKHQRMASYARFQSGHTKHLVTPMVLTEGWDAPWCDGVIIARPTKNPGLFQQMVGRAVRPWEDKTEALVMDVAGATEVATLSSLADLGFDAPETIRIPKLDLDEDELIDPDVDPYAWEEDPPAPVKEVHATEVDFFGESKFHWLETSTGIKFLMAGRELIFLWPALEEASGVYGAMIGHTNLDRTEIATQLGGILAEEHAREYAETVALEFGYSFSRAGRSRPAGWTMLRKLGRFGLSIPDGATTGQAQDLYDIAVAERKLSV